MAPPADINQALPKCPKTTAVAARLGDPNPLLILQYEHTQSPIKLETPAEEAEQQCRWRASISAAQTAAEQVLLVVPDLV